MDYHPGEIPGVSLALIGNVDAEDVLVITLVEYQQDYNGENLILIQIGKKHFREPPPPVQVKIPQIRWAGEKILLEKDWGDMGFECMDPPSQEGSENGPECPPRVVSFQIMSGPGTLEPFPFGFTLGNIVYTMVGYDGVARAILVSEEPGQADVVCVLYETCWDSFNDVAGNLEAEGMGPEMIPIPMMVIDQHDFPVFFIKLEEIAVLDDSPPWAMPEVDALFGVQVKGWFEATNMSPRPERGVDHDQDGTIDEILPKGRWVLPDDWPELAGLPELRTHWDLMNNWEDRVIFSDVSPWGPFNSAVVTTITPGLAEAPTIGPFNTTQRVAVEDEIVKWVAIASVWADETIAFPFDEWTEDDVRNTVVPDGKIEWFDAPMPPAKIIFQATDDLAPAPKFGIEPYYDSVADEWFAPYYSVEIPASMHIPVGGFPEGYNWNSWGFLTDDAMGPYDFWWDLDLSASDEKLEVYSDNNGIAYVYIVGLEVAGEVDIHAKVDYPVQRKHPPMMSEEVTQVWGPLELDSYFETLTPRSGDAPLTVTFINLSWGGVDPYVSAIWDWDDGTAPGTTAVLFGETITHTFTAVGSYAPSLTLTDSSDPALVSVETKEADYILVGLPVTPDILAYYKALTGDPLVAELADVVAAANDYLGGVIPTGFTVAITLPELVQLANDWLGL